MLQSVSKDIMMGKGQDQDLETVFMMMASMDSCSNNMPYLFPPPCPAVKEAAVQRRHNLYRDSIILTNSDPNLHLLGENPQVDWATKFGSDEPEGSVSSADEGRGFGRRRKQVVSMIQLDGVPLPYESCLEVPGVELIPEEDAESKEEENEEDQLGKAENLGPKSPDSVNEIRDLINPVVEVVVPVSKEEQSEVTNKTEPTTGSITVEDGVEEDMTHVTTVVETVPKGSLREKTSPQAILQQLVASKKQEVDKEEAAIQNAIEELEIAVQEDESEQITEISAAESNNESSPPLVTDSSSREDSGFQSPTSEGPVDSEPQPITNGLNGEEKIVDPVEVEVVLS